MPLAGFHVRKAATATYVTTTQYGDWVHLEITDPALVGIVTSDHDIAVTRASDDLRLPVVVLSRTALRILLAVSLPGQARANVAVSLWVYASAGTGVPWTPTTWGTVATLLASDVGPSIVMRDGNGNNYGGGAGTPSARFVHPQVMRVGHLTGAKGWLRYKNDAERVAGVGTVTHVRIDTPYPDGGPQFENPYLLYSTDDGLTWAEFNGSLNPVVPKPADPAFNSDVGFCLRADGSIYCTWRHDDGGTVSTVRRCLVLGTSLGDATVVPDSIVTLTGPTGSPVSPAVTAVSAAEWYLTYFQNASNPRPLYYCLSTDEGATWGAPVLAMASGALGSASGGLGNENVELVRRPWHHGISSEPIGGWWYLLMTETSTAAATTNINLNLRLFRATSPAGPWEPMRVPVATQGTAGGTTATAPYALVSWYQGNVFQRMDGTVAIFASATDGTPSAAAGMEVGVLAIDPTALTPVTLAEAFSFGTSPAGDSPMKYGTAGTARRSYDLAEGPLAGLGDVTGTQNLGALSGAPVQTPGVGYHFAGAGTGLLDTGLNPGTVVGGTTGDDRWVIECEFSVSAADLTGLAARFGPLWAAVSAAGASGVRMEVVGNVASDYLRGAVIWDDAAGVSNTATGAPVNDGGTPIWDDTPHVFRMAYNGAVLRYFFDGDEFFTSNKTNGHLSNVSANLTVGGAPNPYTTASQTGYGTVRRWRYLALTAAERMYDEYAPVVRWTAGVEVLDVPPPTPPPVPVPDVHAGILAAARAAGARIPGAPRLSGRRR